MTASHRKEHAIPGPDFPQREAQNSQERPPPPPYRGGLRPQRKGEMNKIAFFILAAGLGSRFGFPKYLFPMKGKMVIENIIEQCILANVKNLFIVSGAFHEKLASKIKGVPVLFNPEYREGIASSIRISAKFAVENSFEALVILLADQPLVDRIMIGELLEIYSEGYEVVSFEKEGNPCPPTLFVKKLFSDLLNIKGDIGARKIVEENKKKKLIRGYEAKLIDFDTMWEYLSIRKKEDVYHVNY